MKYDYIVVGAGITGVTLAERLSCDKNKEILLVEKRGHIGGNCYDYCDENNIIIQQYGPHIFHTQIEEVWKYLSQFTDWEPYIHYVFAYIEGKHIPLPFNLNSIDMCFEPEKAEKMAAMLLDKYEYGKTIPVLQLRMETDDLMKELVDFIYEKVFLKYNIKQWGMKPEELDKSVTERLPIHITRDNRFFKDKYQGIPLNGYTAMMKRMIDKPNIHLLLNTDFNGVKEKLEYGYLYFTGMIDEYYDYKYGKLPYRSLRFNEEIIDLQGYSEYFQPSSVVNYPYSEDFTRITEFKHFLTNRQYCDKSVIYKEYPIPFNHSVDEIPYYSIPQMQNNHLANNYKQLQTDDVTFIGRLAEYKYYNIDQAVLRALETAAVTIQYD